MGQLLRLLNYLEAEKRTKEANAKISAPQGLSNLCMSEPSGIDLGRMSRTSNLSRLKQNASKSHQTGRAILVNIPANDFALAGTTSRWDGNPKMQCPSIPEAWRLECVRQSQMKFVRAAVSGKMERQDWVLGCGECGVPEGVQFMRVGLRVC